jgi:hypothetical protein
MCHTAAGERAKERGISSEQKQCTWGSIESISISHPINLRYVYYLNFRKLWNVNFQLENFGIVQTKITYVHLTLKLPTPYRVGVTIGSKIDFSE